MIERGIEDFEHRIIDLSHKPPEFVQKYAQAARSSGTTAKVPLLEYGDQLVVESEDVIKFIAAQVRIPTGGDENESSSNSERLLYPVQEVERIDHFIQVFEDCIQGYYKILTATGEAQVKAGKKSFANALLELEECLVATNNNNGPFLLGKGFSVAECYAAPWVHRFDLCLPYFRNMNVWQDKELLLSLPSVATWMEAVRDRHSVTTTNGPRDYVLESTERYFVSYLSPGSPAAICIS